MSPTTDDKPCGRRRGRLLFLAFGLTLTLASCRWTSGAQYVIHWGPARDDVIIRERTSWDLTLARDLFFNNTDTFKSELGGFTCHANRSSSASVRCVMKVLNRQTSIPALARGVWSRATDGSEGVRFDDFSGAFERIRRSEDNRAQVSDCLTLSVYPHTVNWTERARSDSNCRLGEHVFS